MATMLQGTLGKYLLKDEEDTDPDSTHSCSENIIYLSLNSCVDGVETGVFPNEPYRFCKFVGDWFGNGFW